MLCQFTFENYKSFKDEATLDLCAEKIKEHESSLIIDPIDGEAFLPAISIYGPNGGGKSNVLEAFVYLSHKILSPVISLSASESSKDEAYAQRKMRTFNDRFSDGREKHFIFDEKCRGLPTKFDVLFRIDSTEYRYQISLLGANVAEENL